MPQQIKTIHFWLILAATVIGACMIGGLVPDGGKLHQVLAVVQMVLAAFGYQSAANWTPAKAGIQQPDGKSGTGLLLLPLLFAATMLASCAYCLQPAHQSEAKCKAAAIAIDCSPPIIVSTVEAILSDVIVAISGGAVDWMALAQLEEKNGIAAVACAIQKADSFALNPSAPAVHAHAKEYFARKHVAPRSH